MNYEFHLLNMFHSLLVLFVRFYSALSTYLFCLMIDAAMSAGHFQRGANAADPRPQPGYERVGGLTARLER